MIRTKLAYTLNNLNLSKNVLELRLNQLCKVLEQDDPDIETAFYADGILEKIQSTASDIQDYCKQYQDELAPGFEEAGYIRDYTRHWKRVEGNKNE